MKTLLFTAALLLGSAAIGQETPAPPVPPADSPMPTEAPPVPPAPTPPTSAPPPTEAAPMGAPPPAQAAPGQRVVFGTPPTVEEKFPPPPPKAEYPWCSRTVTDGCRQRRDPK